MPVPRPPYSLDTPVFRFGGLAALAGRSSLGGPREIALAAYLTARLAHDALPERGITEEARVDRAAAAKRWLSSLALAAPARAAFSDLVSASAGSAFPIGQAVRRVIAVTAQSLDTAARLELEKLADALESQPLAG
jgi:hypothetical protein